MNIHIKNRFAEEQKREDANSFFSLKNDREVEYGSTAQRYLMMLQEFDSAVTSYEPFDFTVRRGVDGSDVKLCPSLRVDRGDDFELLILSDLLANSKWAAFSAHTFIQAGAGREVPVTFFRPNEVEADNLPANVEFLYQSALLPACREYFPVIKEIVEFCGDITIAHLLRRVRNDTPIYQLIFHGALRANLARGPMDCSTKVSASPLINSIIRNL